MTQAPAHIAADVLVIGAGGAGMYAALAAAEAGQAGSSSPTATWSAVGAPR